MTIQSAMFRPDDGEAPAVGVTVTPARVEPNRLDQVADWLGTIPVAVWITLAAIVVLALVVRAVRKRRGDQQPAKSDKLMTFFGAAVATGVVGTGMWAFFGDTLGIDNEWLRAALFAFFEIAMLASALRSRRFRLDRAAAQAAEDERRAKILAANPGATIEELEKLGYTEPGGSDTHEIDVDGIAVWVLALLSGTLAATHETALGAVGLRLVAPLIAAWLWERGLAGELRQFRRTSNRRKVNWKITPERVAVWLGFAEPTGRAVGQVDRARRIARFARTAYRLHTLEKNGAFRPRIAVAQWRLRRQVEQINEHLSLATDRSVMADVRAHLATYYQAHEGTTPTSVKDLSPWIEPGVMPGRDARVLSGTVSGHPPVIEVGNMPGSLPAIESGITSGAEVDIVTGQSPDISPDAMTGPLSDINPGAAPDRTPGPVRTSRRAQTRASGRAPKPSPAQVKAHKLRANNPGITWAELASKCRVNERTVRRWFETPKPGDGDDKELAMRTDILTVLPAPRPSVTSGTNGHRITEGVSPDRPAE